MKVMRICLLTIIIAISSAQSDWYPCSSCLCQDYTGLLNARKIRCHKVVFMLMDLGLMIECGSANEEEQTMDYSLLWENINLENITHINILRCSLPYEAFFDEINKGSKRGDLRSIGIKDDGILGWSGLTKDHLKTLTQLRQLIIKGNTNLKLTDDFFEWNSKLQTLELDITQAQLSADVFSPLINLQNLSLITKHKLIVPDGLFKHNFNLESLVFRQEHVTFTNKTYNSPGGLLPKLMALNISGTFPVSGKLTHRYLNSLHRLHKMAIDRSNITEIDDDAFLKLPSIEILSLRGNQLSTVNSAVFRNQKNLRFLDLSDNQISTFEISSPLNNVIYMNLNRNRLKKIDVSELASLERLEINNNQLESIKLRSMMFLDVSYNRLKSLRSKFRTIEIGYVNISHNLIKKVDFIQKDPGVKASIGEINIGFNNISKMSADDIIFLTSTAIHTDLRNNPITTVHPINITKLENVYKYSTIDIENVPFDCSCSIYDLVEYSKRKIKPIYFIIGNSTCFSPSSMKGRLLKDLEECDLVCDEKEQCSESCHCHRGRCDNVSLVTCSLQTPAPPLQFSPETRKLELTIKNSIVNPFQIDKKTFRQVSKPNIPNENLLSVTIPKSTFYPSQIDEIPFQNVSKPYISNENLLTVTVQDIPDNIQVLDLRNSSISHVSENVVNKLKGSSSLETIYISGNKIVCDCENQAFLEYIQSEISIFEDVQDEKCFNRKELIILVSITDLCEYGEAYTIAGVTVAVAIFVVITCIALYYKYQTEVKVWLFAKRWFVSWITEEEIDKDKVYDAFLSWSHKDDEFVLNEILSKLEEGPNPFKICIHYRDWDVGEMINTQINRSIKRSRRTLVVLTPNFLTSAWGMYEFKQAHCYALEEKRVRVIMICHGDLGPKTKLDPDLQAYLATRTYIEWGDPRFWEKLMYALPHPTGRTDLDGTFYYRSGLVQFRRRG